MAIQFLRFEEKAKYDKTLVYNDYYEVFIKSLKKNGCLM